MKKVKFLQILMVSIALLVGCQNEPDIDPNANTPQATAVAAVATHPPAPPTMSPTPFATLAAPALPTAPATITPSPTPIASNTPIATNTPLPTATFPPAPTNPPPTPTSTPLSTPNSFGLSAGFIIEGGPVFAVNQDIWFQFDIKNPNQVTIEYAALGLYPRKNGVDRLDLFQYSWTNATMVANGFTWRDHINLPETGDYTVRIAICLNASLGECQNGGGTWITLSPYEHVVWVR